MIQPENYEHEGRGWRLCETHKRRFNVLPVCPRCLWSDYARLQAEVERLREAVADLIGAERPGPNERCSDCGRRMVWTDESGHAWMCPSCVHWRMERAEERIARAALGEGE